MFFASFGRLFFEHRFCIVFELIFKEFSDRPFGDNLTLTTAGSDIDSIFNDFQSFLDHLALLFNIVSTSIWESIFASILIDFESNMVPEIRPFYPYHVKGRPKAE